MWKPEYCALKDNLILTNGTVLFCYSQTTILIEGGSGMNNTALRAETQSANNTHGFCKRGTWEVLLWETGTGEVSGLLSQGFDLHSRYFRGYEEPFQPDLWYEVRVHQAGVPAPGLADKRQCPGGTLSCPVWRFPLWTWWVGKLCFAPMWTG